MECNLCLMMMMDCGFRGTVMALRTLACLEHLLLVSCLSLPILSHMRYKVFLGLVVLFSIQVHRFFRSQYKCARYHLHCYVSTL